MSIQPHMGGLVAAVILTAVPAATAQVTCGQPNEVFAQCPGSTAYSVSDVPGGIATADDFVLAAPASLTRIRWWGLYADQGGSANCGPHTDSFGVAVWNDTNGSGPDWLGLVADLSSFPITRSAAPVATVTVGPTTFPVYEYEVDLSSSPLALAGGVTYWLEVHNWSPPGTCLWGWVIDPLPSNGYWSYLVLQIGLPPWGTQTFPFATPGFDFAFALVGGSAGGPVAYCTAGTSASGCAATLSASGTASATAPSGFVLSAATVEGNKDGLYFIGTSGRQANAWGTGTSFQCVVPPVKRTGLLSGSGTNGNCNGAFSKDMNAHWCPTCPKPAQNPGAGTVVQAQLWYRDPVNTSNQTTSLSDAIEFLVGP